jgi:hypothetical protein
MQEILASLPIGAVIQGHYTVESLLGKGDFGSVYLVQDQHDQQKLFALAEVVKPNEKEKYRFTLEYVSPRPAELPEPSVSPRPTVPSQTRTRYVWKPGWLLFVLALLLLIGLGLLPNARGHFATHPAAPTPRLAPTAPTSTPASSIYPTPTRTYDGTIFDLSSNVSTGISLSGIRPGEGNISGYLTLGPNCKAVVLLAEPSILLNTFSS